MDGLFMISISCGILWNNSGSGSLTTFLFLVLLLLVGSSDGAFVAGGGFLPAGFFPCGSSAFVTLIGESFFFVFGANAFDLVHADDVDALAVDADDVDGSASASVIRGFVFLNILPIPVFLPIVVVVADAVQVQEG